MLLFFFLRAIWNHAICIKKVTWLGGAAWKLSHGSWLGMTQIQGSLNGNTMVTVKRYCRPNSHFPTLYYSAVIFVPFVKYMGSSVVYTNWPVHCVYFSMTSCYFLLPPIWTPRALKLYWLKSLKGNFLKSQLHGNWVSKEELYVNTTVWVFSAELDD